jgi:hypothetical protein
MYSDSDYYYQKNSFNISQSTINVIIVVVILVIFFFIFNYCSKNYFTNLNTTSDNQFDDLKNELAFVKEELFNKNYFYKQTNDAPFRTSTSANETINETINKVKNETINEVKNETINEVKNETINEVKLPETQKIYNTDFLLNGDININNPKQNIPSKVVQNITPKVVQNITPKVVQNRIPFGIQDPNINYQNDFINYQNDFINYNNLQNTPNNDILVQQFAPPIIYDPIENYDRLKLTDPLVDPRGRSSADQIPTPQVAAQLNFPTQGIIDRYHRVGLLKAIDNHEYNNKNNRNNRRSDSRDNRDSYEDFGNVEKVVKGKKINIDSDSSSSDNTSNLSKYSDNSSDLQTISSSYNSKFKEKIIPNNVVLDIGDRDNDILELIGKKIANEWYRYFTSISKGNKIIKINVNNKNRKELYDGDVVYIPILKRHYRVKIDKMDMIDYNPYFF